MTAYAVHDFATGTEAIHDDLNALADLGGYDRTTADVTTADGELVALTVDIAVLDSQAVLILVNGRVSCDVAGAQIIGTIRRDGSGLAQACRFVAPANGNIDILSAHRIDFPGASGTYTYDFLIFRGAGSGDVSLLHADSAPGELIVVRLGVPS